jgi:predicted RNA polymerase sigma factor
VGHYDSLVTIDPSPAARLARAVAVAEASGPAAGLAALDGIDIPGSHRPASVRAELLTRLDRSSEARLAYDEAIALCRNEAELAYLMERRDSLA